MNIIYDYELIYFNSDIYFYQTCIIRTKFFSCRIGLN